MQNVLQNFKFCCGYIRAHALNTRKYNINNINRGPLPRSPQCVRRNLVYLSVVLIVDRPCVTAAVINSPIAWPRRRHWRSVWKRHTAVAATVEYLTAHACHARRNGDASERRTCERIIFQRGNARIPACSGSHRRQCGDGGIAVIIDVAGALILSSRILYCDVFCSSSWMSILNL